jgi:hypothetical protein
MAKKAKTTLNYVIRCVHCMTDEFKLTDVNPEEFPKDYTDTPAKYRSKRSRPLPNHKETTLIPTPFGEEKL